MFLCYSIKRWENAASHPEPWNQIVRRDYFITRLIPELCALAYPHNEEAEGRGVRGLHHHQRWWWWRTCWKHVSDLLLFPCHCRVFFIKTISGFIYPPETHSADSSTGDLWFEDGVDDLMPANDGFIIRLLCLIQEDLCPGTHFRSWMWTGAVGARRR